jgi:hypothetical protein
VTDNSGKIILDLCGGTGAWSRPYKEAGYDVRLVTLPDNDVLTYEPPTGVYGILAAPPCTEFSVAKNGSKRKRDLALGMETVRACLEIIWKCQIYGKLTFWAMENPRGLLRRFMGKPVITFDPWQYGDGWTKKTDLWGYFTPPKPIVTVQPVGLTRRYANGKSNAFCWTTCYDRVPDWYDGPKLDRAGRRAITPPGFAKAFYEANK